jgi:hypothetical protein
MKILNHYTRGSGLLGVLNSDRLWATHTAFLNDASEYRYGFDVAREIVERITELNSNWAPKHPELAELIAGESTTHLEGGKLPSVFVSCFSTVGDDLSQWRGYTDPGDGYTLEFDQDRLAESADAQGWRLVPVLYGTSADTAVANLAVEAFAKLDNGEYGADPSPAQSAYREFLRALHYLAPTLKDAAFSAENEWRLISPMLDHFDSSIKWRPGKSYLVPYVEFALGAPASRTIVGFGLGPSPHPELAVSAMLMLANQHGYRVGVAMPGTPFRGW